MSVEPIRWREGMLQLLDQRKLPGEELWVTCRDAHEVAVAIRDMIVRGARLTAWDLQRDGIDVTLITDNMSGHFFQQNTFDAVIVGADRIAANGDTANKIGTYTLAVLANAHGVPFYVAAPVSTIDTA